MLILNLNYLLLLIFIYIQNGPNNKILVSELRQRFNDISMKVVTAEEDTDIVIVNDTENLSESRICIVRISQKLL